MMANEQPARQTAARQRSKSVWGEMATGWYARREELWEFSQPIAEWMVRKIDPQPGDTVLEVAAGAGDTGFLAARQLGEAGRLISTDFAPEMVAAARRRAAELGVSNAEFRVLDAEQMELERNSVDGVLCRWGYMLMLDPAAALSESQRVLRPGGRLAFSVFAAPQHNPWAALIVQVLVAEGHMAPPNPNAPGIFALRDPERIRKLVSGAGFTEPEIEEMELIWSFADQDSYWRFLLEAAGALSPMLRALSPTAEATVRQKFHELARPFQTGKGYEFPAKVLNVAARPVPDTPIGNP